MLVCLWSSSHVKRLSCQARGSATTPAGWVSSATLVGFVFVFGTGATITALAPLLRCHEQDSSAQVVRPCGNAPTPTATAVVGSFETRMVAAPDVGCMASSAVLLAGWLAVCCVLFFIFGVLPCFPFSFKLLAPFRFCSFLLSVLKFFTANSFGVLDCKFLFLLPRVQCACRHCMAKSPCCICNVIPVS